VAVVPANRWGATAIFQNLRIRTKVAIAFGLVLAVTLSLGLFAVQRLALVHERAADARDNWFPATRALGDYAFETMRVRQMQAAIITAPPEMAGDELRLLIKILGDVQRTWARYERDLTPEARALASRIAAGWESYLALDARLRAMLAAPASNDAAFAFYTGDMRRAYAEWRDVLTELIDLQMREGDRNFRDGEQAYLSARTWIYGAIGLAVGLSGLAGLFIVLSISRPVRRLTLLMNRLAINDLSVSVEGAERRDEIGAMAKAVQVFKHGLRERDQLAAELQRQATSDPLTGALNRRAFRDRVERDMARARRHGRPLAIAMIDIDHFKRLNDTMGHATGDRFLVAVTQALAAELRSEDLFCRYGGEEFLVAFSETDEAGAIVAAERLREAIAAIRLVHADGIEYGITASLGVAAFEEELNTLDGVVNAADGALYRAKTGGRNRVVAHHATLAASTAA
jgi:diguanylate cyclase (GGDEF)-like protein